MSRVDVFVPCYKYGHFLRDCVKSVLAPQDVDVRVLILDDASPDNTPEVAEQLVREDARVSYRRHAVNRGHIETFNEGLEWASGDYTLLLSADDLLTPGALGRAARLMDAHPDVGLTYGGQIEFSGEQPPAEIPVVPEHYTWRIRSSLEFLEHACGSSVNFVPTPTAVLRTSMQRRLGGYRACLTHTGDFEMWMRYAAHGPVGVIEAPQAFYRRHTTNMSLDYYAGGGVRDMQQRKACFDVLFQDWGHAIPDAERLRALSTRTMERIAVDMFWRGSQAFDEGNLAVCRACHECALAVYPSLRTSAIWRRFRCKQMLGHRFWSLMRPVLNRLRGKRPAPVAKNA